MQGLKEESQQDCTVKTNHGFMNEDPFPLPTGKTLVSKIASPVEQLFTRHQLIEEILNCVCRGFPAGAKFGWWTGFLSFVQQTLV